MTAVQEPIAPAQPATLHYAKPHTDAAALRDISHEVHHLHEKAEEIKQAPEQFHPMTLLNLPQLSIMISLQVSANRAQAASDKRAIADHETLIALHAMATQQLQILKQQDSVLAILNQFASKDMPGRQQDIQSTVNQILAAVSGHAGS